MMLNDKQLREALANEQIKMGNIATHAAGSNTIDVTLGNKFLVPKATDEPFDIANPDMQIAYEEVDGPIVIPPMGFVLAVVRERIELDNQHMATIYGRSNTSRLGLMISAGPIIDAGFCGTITLELFNYAPYPIKLTEGYRIGHFAFTRLESPAEIGYMNKPSAKYTDQEEVVPYPWRRDVEFLRKAAVKDEKSSD